jgi:hypothetical protein
MNCFMFIEYSLYEFDEERRITTKMRQKPTEKRKPSSKSAADLKQKDRFEQEAYTRQLSSYDMKG